MSRDSSSRGRRAILRAVVGLLMLSAATPATTAGVSCTETFSPISAAAYVEAINPGWNLGNTLDAIPNEGSWNNRPVVGTTFDDVKAQGFKSIRIPVTYADHFTSGSPSWTVDAKWLDRVSEVVDMATSRGLYALTNVHHDSWNWADITKANANISAIEEQLYRLWYQIGTRLSCKSSMVAFETINEPPALDVDDAAEINKFNEIFLRALSDSGGFNARRVVTLNGGSMDAAKTSQWFKPPSNMTNPWALQFHYYSPYDFVFGAWGKTIWGSDADKLTLKTDLGIVRGNFTEVPLIIGEFDASPINTEPAARWKYFDYFIRAASEIGASTMIWDNGLDHLDRAAHSWRDPTTLRIIKHALAGTRNSLPDSTTDPASTTQYSSAYIFHKVGDPISDQVLPWLFNGNTLASAKSALGTSLSTSDYSSSSSAITFKTSLLNKYFSDKTTGVKDNITLSFSAGADIAIQVVQWDVPTFSSTSSKAVSGQDLTIPVTFKGVKSVAAVKIQAGDGAYLVDDWTQWLPPLQQGRATYNNHYFFEDTFVRIQAAAVNAVIASGKTTTFTFEFYPRVAGNSVQYTLTP